MNKKKEIICLTRKVPTFPFNLTVTNDYATYCELTNYKTPNGFETTGVCSQVGGNFYLGVFDESVDVLFHELSHLRDFMMDELNIKHDTSNTEFTAYYFQSLFIEITHVLKLKIRPYDDGKKKPTRKVKK